MLEAIKLAALDALDRENMSDFCYGTVTGINPLRIMLEQKIELTEQFLNVTQKVTDYKISGRITIQGDTERSFLAEVKNHLCVGDKVLLCKAMGGQQYAVLDRLAGEEYHDTTR